jgi:hypothetical protein
MIKIFKVEFHTMSQMHYNRRFGTAESGKLAGYGADSWLQSKALFIQIHAVVVEIHRVLYDGKDPTWLGIFLHTMSQMHYNGRFGAAKSGKQVGYGAHSWLQSKPLLIQIHSVVVEICP